MRTFLKFNLDLLTFFNFERIPIYKKNDDYVFLTFLLILYQNKFGAIL